MNPPVGVVKARLSCKCNVLTIRSPMHGPLRKRISNMKLLIKPDKKEEFLHREFNNKGNISTIFF